MPNGFFEEGAVGRATRRHIGPIASRPTAGQFDGQEYYDNVNHRLWMWDGTGWVCMSEPTQTYTPTLTGMVVGTGGTNNMQWHRSDGWADFEWFFQFGTSGQTYPSSPTVSLPFAYAIANGEITHDALYVDAGVFRYLGFALPFSAAGFQLGTFGGAPVGVTTTTPFTWGPGDYGSVHGRARMSSRYT